MARSFTHYWKNSTWEEERSRGAGLLDHAASNQFLERGISPEGGSTVTVRNGEPLLGCRLDAAAVVSQGSAERLLGRSLSEARDTRRRALDDHAARLVSAKLAYLAKVAVLDPRAQRRQA